MAEVMQWKNNSMILPVDKYILELTKQLTGLLVGRGEKSQISWDFPRQIRRRNSRFHKNFTGIFEANFSEGT